jgi:hypothetical protein
VGPVSSQGFLGQVLQRLLPRSSQQDPASTLEQPSEQAAVIEKDKSTQQSASLPQFINTAFPFLDLGPCTPGSDRNLSTMESIRGTLLGAQADGPPQHLPQLPCET